MDISWNSHIFYIYISLSWIYIYIYIMAFVDIIGISWIYLQKPFLPMISDIPSTAFHSSPEPAPGLSEVPHQLRRQGLGLGAHLPARGAVGMGFVWICWLNCLGVTVLGFCLSNFSDFELFGCRFLKIFFYSIPSIFLIPSIISITSCHINIDGIKNIDGIIYRYHLVICYIAMERSAIFIAR